MAAERAAERVVETVEEAEAALAIACLKSNAADQYKEEAEAALDIAYLKANAADKYKQAAKVDLERVKQAAHAKLQQADLTKAAQGLRGDADKLLAEAVAAEARMTAQVPAPEAVAAEARMTAQVPARLTETPLSGAPFEPVEYTSVQAVQETPGAIRTLFRSSEAGTAWTTAQSATGSPNPVDPAGSPSASLSGVPESGAESPPNSAESGAESPQPNSAESGAESKESTPVHAESAKSTQREKPKKTAQPKEGPNLRNRNR